MASRAHPTAEVVYEEVRRYLPHISLGTVYRNLHILARQGKVKELDLGDGARRYDAFVGDHYHFVCERCRRVFDLDVPPQPEIVERMKPFAPGEVRSYRLDFIGICNSCLQK
jgi:Fur family peroxide stress response transcriptional regulator